MISSDVLALLFCALVLVSRTHMMLQLHPVLFAVTIIFQAVVNNNKIMRGFEK
jgi:hypothetical protein